MNKFFKVVLNLIYPCRCAFCNKVIPLDSLTCDECREKVKDVNTIKTFLGNSYCVSPFPYKDIYKQPVKNLKYSKNKYYAETMAYYIVASIRENYDVSMFDCVTAVPQTKKQLRKRGYNHAEQLGRNVAELLKIPYVECLLKIKENQYQHTLKRDLRQANVQGVFEIADKEIKGKNILLIDDVTTTGSTLRECSKMLIKNKNEVYCGTFCKA